MSATPMALGIDPDLHTTGAAICHGTKVQAVYLIAPKHKAKGAEAVMLMARQLKRTFWGNHSVSRVAVETPQVYQTGVADPEDLIYLATVTGAALGAAMAAFPIVKASLPSPADWKGQVPKVIHHQRICRMVGWECEVHRDRVLPLVPDGVEIHGKIAASTWSHVLDAVGLAVWACSSLAGITAARLDD